MYKIIILASVLVLFGCGRDDNQENNTNAKAQSQDNKAITVKKPSSSEDKGLRELEEESHGLKWKQNKESSESE
jgi:hypothetical protein